MIKLQKMLKEFLEALEERLKIKSELVTACYYGLLLVLYLKKFSKGIGKNFR